jgi:hypothetical protein
MELYKKTSIIDFVTRRSGCIVAVAQMLEIKGDGLLSGVKYGAVVLCRC